MLSSGELDSNSAVHSNVRFMGLKAPDGARSMVGTLGPDLWSLAGSSYLILPSERLVKEVVASEGSADADRIMTVKRLTGFLYDLYGGPYAVRDDLFREAAVARIMEAPDVRKLRPAGGMTRGMARHVAESIKELMINERDHTDLSAVARTNRSKELALIYQRYADLLRSSGSVDVETLPSLVGEMIGKDPEKVAGSFFGIYMPGRIDRSYSGMLASLTRACRGALVMEHEVRVPPVFIGSGIPWTPSSTIPAPGSRSREAVRWPNSVDMIRGDDRISSLRAVCRHIKYLVKEKDVDPAEIAVVTPGGSLHERYLTTVLCEFGIPYSMDREIHASEVPAVSGIMGLLALPSDEWRSMRLAECLTELSGHFAPDGGMGVTGPELSLAFTEVPVFGGPDPEEGWIDPMRRYLEEGGSPERIGSVCERAIDALDPLLGRIRDLSSAKLDSRRMASKVREFIGFAIGSLRDPIESELITEALEKLDRSAARVPRIDPANSDPIGLGSFVEMLRMCLDDAKIELHSSGEGVWVGKIRQQAARSSKYVFLHSMTDLEYPPRTPDFRILSHEERSALSLRERPDRREALEDIAICLSSATVPIVSIHTSESDKPVGISTMLEDLELRELCVGDEPRSRMEVLRMAACSGEDRSVRNSSKVRIVDPAATMGSLDGGKSTWERVSARKQAFSGEGSPFRGRILDDVLVRCLTREFGPEHVWSASRLESYRKCPYDFFVRYVLRIRPFEKLDPEVPPDRKGTILHSILEGFYARWKLKGKDRIAKGEEDSAFAVILASAREVLSSYPYHGPFWEALSDLLLGVDGEKGLLREFIESEASYEGPFAVEGTEVTFGSGDPVRIEGTHGGFFMEGIVDRIDSCGEKRMIWDYKTGSPAYFKAKDSLQVPLYLASLKALHPGWIPAGGGYYWVGTRGSVGREIVLGNDLDPDDALRKVEGSIRDSVDDALEEIELIRSGDFSVPEPCPNRTYCEFSDICRRDES